MHNQRTVLINVLRVLSLRPKPGSLLGKSVLLWTDLGVSHLYIQLLVRCYICPLLFALLQSSDGQGDKSHNFIMLDNKTW